MNEITTFIIKMASKKETSTGKVITNMSTNIIVQIILMLTILSKYQMQHGVGVIVFLKVV